MTEHQMGNRDCGADPAAYVLGALEPEEAEAFRVHLTTCVVCRDEVSAFQEVADALPLVAPPQRVPHGLKRRVMASVRAEPHGAPAQRPRRRRMRLPPNFFAAMPAPALALSAVLVALVIVVAGVAVLSDTSTNTHVYSAQVTWNGNAQLRVTDSRGELTVHGMPAPPADKVYEVWLLRRGASAPSPTSALFNVTSSGSGSVDVPGDLHDVKAVLVTPEPLGGSQAPTHAPILQALIS